MRLLTYTLKFGRSIGVFPVFISKENNIKYILYKLYLLLSSCLILFSALVTIKIKIKKSYYNRVTYNVIDVISYFVEVIFILICRITAIIHQNLYVKLCQRFNTLERCLNCTNFAPKKANTNNLIIRILILHAVLFGVHIRELIIKLKKGEYEFLLAALNHVITMYYQIVIFQFIVLANHILLTR